MNIANHSARWSRALLCFALSTCLIGCGTGIPSGGDQSTPSDPSLPSTVDDPSDNPDGNPPADPTDVDTPDDGNAPPVANAGADLTVASGDLVQLDGTLSGDPDDDPLAFTWTIAAGIDVVLTNANGAQATFVAPHVDQDLVLRFSLTVDDGREASSDQVDVFVQADAPPTPSPPTADAGVDQTVVARATVTLDGTASSGAQSSHLVFEWTQVSGIDATIANPSVSSTTFTAPNVDSDSTLVFELTVTQEGLSSGDQVSVIVQPAPAPPPGPAPPPPPPTDNCPNDPNKAQPGICGCGVPDTDHDGDGTPDCIDGCPDDPTKTNAADCPDPTRARDTDWELYMLRLVNRARRDPAGEAARIGSSIVDNRAPLPPLAYDLAVAQAAENHNRWMHGNFGSIPSGRIPDSFSHFETLNGLSNGTPATGTTGFTGAGVGERFVFAAYQWSSYGENIQTNYSTTTLPVNGSQIDASHKGWWESTGHRNNMLQSTFTAFGFHVESRAFTPPRGGLNAPFDNIFFATQDFGRPLSSPQTYVFGVFYDDADGNAAWTPRDVGDPLREGVSGATVEILAAGTTSLIATTTSMGNGAFSARVGAGTYDVVFHHASLPGGQMMVKDVIAAGANVDIGDVSIP